MILDFLLIDDKFAKNPQPHLIVRSWVLFLSILNYKGQLNPLTFSFQLILAIPLALAAFDSYSDSPAIRQW